MNRILLILFSLLQLLLLSCNRLSFDLLKENQIYVGLIGNSDCAIVIDEAVEGNVKGKVYFDDDSQCAQVEPFTSDIGKNGKGNLWLADEQMPLKVKQKRTDIVVSVTSEQQTYNFILKHSKPTCDLDFKPEYRKPTYTVLCEHGRIYANDVEGYWASYPETDETVGKIYQHKVRELLMTHNLDLDMDIYYPQEESRHLHPLLLLIHGGAFYNGDKESVGCPAMARHFASMGYVVASINYRLGFRPLRQDIERAGYRAVQDANAAVRYLVGNADEFKIDTSNIFVGGTSAGAITALNLAFMREEDRPKSSREVSGDALKEMLVVGSKKGINVIRKIGDFLGIRKSDDVDWDDEAVNLNLKSDLGGINTINPENDSPFKIKAVVNMWGAVHKLEMLKNSTNTSILSFHCVNDPIVPYSYDYPFSALNDFIDEILDNSPDFIERGVNAWRRDKKPLNELVFDKMYGSSPIHNKAISLGMHSELHPYTRGTGHSLNVDEYNNLSKYYYDSILPITTRFLYDELVDGGVYIGSVGKKQYQALNISNVDEMYWNVEGGAILYREKDKVKVLYFADSPKHSITLCGKYKNGVEFNETKEEKF